MLRLSWSLLPPLALALIVLSIRGSSFEVCNDGCTILSLGAPKFLIAAHKSVSFYRHSRKHLSIDTTWLGPLSLRFLIRNGMLIVYPGLPLSFILVIAILSYQYARSPMKPRAFTYLGRAAAALGLLIVTHSDFHASIFGSEYQGYNKHVVIGSEPLPPEWFEAKFNCSSNSFPLFGDFSLISAGTAPCLIYKFSGTLGFDDSDCDVVRVGDGSDTSFSPYGPFWKRAIFLQQAGKGGCLDSGDYDQLWYADNDNIVDYRYQGNLTAPYSAMFRNSTFFSTGINAVTLGNGHSEKIYNFSSEWLSFHDHEKVKTSRIHDLAPFQAQLGSLNDFPNPLNGAVKFKTRHCSRHTLNRNRCVRGGVATPNLELQVINDMMALQLFVSLLVVTGGAWGWGIPGRVFAAVEKMESGARCVIFGVGAILLGLFLGLEVGGSLPLPDVSDLAATKFMVWVRNKRFYVSWDGVAVNAYGDMLSGNRMNGFTALSGDILSWLQLSILVSMLVFVQARLLGTGCFWKYDVLDPKIKCSAIRQ